MIGAIIGDMVGSPYDMMMARGPGRATPLFVRESHFTDDSLMTLAVAKALMMTKDLKDNEELRKSTIAAMREVARPYLGECFWGRDFREWMANPVPYGSWANGSAMRISPVAWVVDNEEDLFRIVEVVTNVSHNSEDGLNGAKVTALAVYLARNGASKEEIRKRCSEIYPEIETIKYLWIETSYEVDDIGSYLKCANSVPQAISAFLEGESFEETLQNVMALKADTDTQGAIAGSIAEAYYGVDPKLEKEALSRLTPDLLKIYNDFAKIKGQRIKKQ